MTPAGFPHSEIPGSRLVCSSPGLIAAYHVFHRLLTPRHPPSALSNLIENLGARSRLASRSPEGLIPKDLRHTDRSSSRSGFRLIRSCQRSLLAPEQTGARKNYCRRVLVEITGLEPATSALQRRRSPS
jgi:hypothetical protein